MREAAQYITQHARPGDTFLANFPDPAQGYYLRQIDLPYAMLPPRPDFDPAEVNTLLDRLEQQRPWFIPVWASQWDREMFTSSPFLPIGALR